MEKLNFLIPRDYHLELMARTLRKDDIEELNAIGQVDIHETLLDSVKRSETCVVACLDDEPLVIYGMYNINILTDTALIWMLGTENSLNYPKEFMVYTRKVINEMLLVHSELTNYVYSENVVSIKWLKALGFFIEDPIEIGVNNKMFHKFYKNRGMK